MPKGWKFDAKTMPAKGSKWILFIEFAVPKPNAFELYQGSYGRQPATDENVNNLYSLLDNTTCATLIAKRRTEWRQKSVRFSPLPWKL